MSPPPSIDATVPDLPPVVRAQCDAATPPIRSWASTIAPAYLGVLAWFPLLDQLPAAAPTGAGVLARFASACLALLACYGLLYLPQAMLGLRTRRRSTTIAAEVLGADGAEWIAGVLYGLSAALWGSVAIAYSARMTLDGLVVWGLLDPEALRPSSLGGVAVEGPLVLIALAFWTFIIVSANGLGLMGVITAMMKVYAPFAACLLVAACWCRLDAQAGTGPGVGGSSTGLEPRTFQYVFGAFAFAGVMAVDWGGVVRDKRDVRLGGWLGILAPGSATCLAALALAVSGPYVSVRAALADGLGGTTGPRLAGGLLLLFGLASLAPACYAAPVFTERVRGHWPSLRRWKGVFLGSILLFLPGATGVAWRLETLATISGALFASLAGVLTTESFRRRSLPRPPARGWRGPGIAAWGLGVLVGLAPLVGEGLHAGWLRTLQPAALIAYLASMLASFAVGRFLPERSSTEAGRASAAESPS